MNEPVIYILGIILGASFGVLVTVGYIDESPDIVKSPTPITPSIELTTDGKTVDTLYVYKIER